MQSGTKTEKRKAAESRHDAGETEQHTFGSLVGGPEKDDGEAAAQTRSPIGSSVVSQSPETAQYPRITFNPGNVFPLPNFYDLNFAD